MLPTPDALITLPPPLDGGYSLAPRFEGSELRVLWGGDEVWALDADAGTVRKLSGDAATLEPRSPWRATARSRGQHPLRFRRGDDELRDLVPLSWDGEARVVDVVGDLVLWCEGYEGRFELRTIAEDQVVMTASVPGAGPEELAVSGDGRVIAATGDGLLWLFEADAWDDPRRFRLPGMLDARAALDAAGERLALLHHDALRLFAVDRLCELPRPVPLGLGDDALDHVALSADGARLAASVDGGGVAIADLATGAVARRDQAEHLGHLALSADGLACAWTPLSGTSRELALPPRITAETTLPEPRPLPGEPTAALLTYHPDGRHVAMVVGHYDLARVELRERGGALVATFPCEGLPLRLALSPDGRFLAWAETSGAVRTWDLLAAGGPRPVLEASTPPGRGLVGAARSVHVTAEATWIAEVGGRVHRALHGSELELDWLPWDGDEELVRPVALTPGARFLAWAEDETATVIDTASREVLLTVPAADFGESLLLPGDGHLLVVDHAAGGLVWRVVHGGLLDPAPTARTLTLDAELPWEAPRRASDVPSELEGEAIGWYRHLSTALDEAGPEDRRAVAPELAGLARVLAAYASLRRQEGLHRAVELAHEAGLIEDGPDTARLPTVRGPALPRDPSRAVERVGGAEPGIWEAREELLARALPGETAELIEAACGRVGEQLRFEAAFRGFEAAGGPWTTARLARAIDGAESGEEVLAALVIGLSSLAEDGGGDVAPLAAIAGDVTARPATCVAALTALRSMGERGTYRAALTAHEHGDRLERMVDFLVEWAWQLSRGLGVA